MRTNFTLLLLFSYLFSFGQTYLPLQNDYQPGSGDNIKFSQGSYAFSDTEQNGVIQIVGKENVTLDGDSVEVDGGTFDGYFIYLENSNNVTIKNFYLAKGYFYAVYAVNCQNIIVENCNFSQNERTDEGWIVIFDGPDLAHGGGVYMNQCKNSTVRYNFMTDQNDGVAAYNCDSLLIHDNDLSWNTSYGIRLWYTDACYIHHNNCSHVNRPFTDPSDCAALLMFRSHNHRVEYNDLSYSGDGVFLTDYMENVPGNNYIAYNECSYSPHNAIEATFSDGNVFKQNKCNNSNWGLWLGYSWNTIVDSNEIEFNAGLDPDQGGGIAIDRGYNNVITNNSIAHNHRGIRLWEGNLISPYTNSSHDYLIENNTFLGNKEAIYSDNVEHLVSKENSFSRNFHDVLIKGNADNDTITGNNFSTSAGFYIENKSFDDIFAEGNQLPSSQALLDCKIFDEDDIGAYGKVEIEPFIPLGAPTLLPSPPADLAEPPAVWDAYYYVEDAGETIISWDTGDKKDGSASLFVDTEGGWDFHLHYFPPDPDTGGWRMASWSLADTGYIRFWMKFNITDPTNLWGIQEGFIRIGDNCGNYYQYAMNPGVVNNAWGPWRYFQVPLTGNSNWARTEQGEMTFDEVAYIEFNVDVWGYGYELWLDGISLPEATPSGVGEANHSGQLPMTASPNPFSEGTILAFELEKQECISVEVCDLTGKVVWNLQKEEKGAGRHELFIPAEKWMAGAYYIKIIAGDKTGRLKVLKL